MLEHHVQPSARCRLFPSIAVTKHLIGKAYTQQGTLSKNLGAIRSTSFPSVLSLHQDRITYIRFTVSLPTFADTCVPLRWVLPNYFYRRSILVEAKRLPYSAFSSTTQRQNGFSRGSRTSARAARRRRCSTRRRSQPKLQCRKRIRWTYGRSHFCHLRYPRRVHAR